MQGTKAGKFMRSVVITGASTGIGFATTKVLLARGFRVFGSVRKIADAERLSREWGSNFTPLLFDVTDEAAVIKAARDVRAAEFAVLSGNGKGAEIHAQARRERIAAGKDRSSHSGCIDDGKPQSALSNHVRSAAAVHR
jgi:NAD(P)-dependent dehydrogenase (short-subunit alcohol dehydrogenase family)